MKTVVLDAATLGSDTDLSPLGEVGELTVYDLTPQEKLAERIRDAQVIVTNKWRLGEQELAQAGELKLICVTATGYDNIDTAYCRGRGIGLCNVPGYSADSVAQLTLAMVLSLATRLGQYRAFVHSGEYSHGTAANRMSPVWHELAGKTWGIVGCGSIGRKVAAAAQAMGCRVLAYRRGQDPDFETADLETVLRASDIVTVHLPLNDETRGILSKARIGLMKPDAIFVNVARGAIADEAALCEAMEGGRLGGLGVDVYSREPFPPEHPYNRLLENPNVILTPHCAWGSLESRNRCMVRVAENIAAFGKGERKNRIV